MTDLITGSPNTFSNPTASVATSTRNRMEKRGNDYSGCLTSYCIGSPRT